MAKFETERPHFTSYGLSCVRWNPSPMQRPDHHNEIQLNILRRGRVTYMVGGLKIKVKPGHLTAFWAAIPHQSPTRNTSSPRFRSPGSCNASCPTPWFPRSCAVR
jgi:hypothetical protein